MSAIDHLEFEPDEIAAAQSWHGGQSSMLYAVASTGELRRGTWRPGGSCGCDDGCDDCDGTGWISFSDREWLIDLIERLESEASEAADDARERLDEDCDDDPIDPEEIDALESIVAKCAAALAELGGGK